MLTTTGTDFKAHVIFLATLPTQWRVSAKRAWSYGVYYVGYRLLSVQLSCGSLALSGAPLVMKYAAA